MQFKPEVLYIFDTRNVVNEFTGHKQVLYSLRRDGFEMVSLHLNCISGLVSLVKQFYEDLPQELQLGATSVFVLESRERGVILACATSQLSARRYLQLIDDILLSQIGSYAETMKQCGLRYLRDIIETEVAVILECLGAPHPGFLPLRCVIPQPRFQTLQLATQVLEQLRHGTSFFEVHAVETFSPKGEYVCGTALDFELRALLQSICFMQTQNRTPRAVRAGHDATSYMEVKVQDEYAARKGQIVDPESFTDINTELRCGPTRIIRHAFSSVFAEGCDNALIQTVPIQGAAGPAHEQIVWAPHIWHNGTCYLQFSTPYMDLNWVALIAARSDKIDQSYVQETISFSLLLDKTIHEVVQFAGSQVEDEAPDLPEAFFIDELTRTAGLQLAAAQPDAAIDGMATEQPQSNPDLIKIAKYLKYSDLERVEEDGVPFDGDAGRFQLAQI